MSIGPVLITGDQQRYRYISMLLFTPHLIVEAQVFSYPKIHPKHQICEYNHCVSLALTPDFLLHIPQEGFAFSHCTECRAAFLLRANVPPDRWWSRLKFQLLVARDHTLIFFIVQLVRFHTFYNVVQWTTFL
jgi:hypothetical protein